MESTTTTSTSTSRFSGNGYDNGSTDHSSTNNVIRRSNNYNSNNSSYINNNNEVNGNNVSNGSGLQDSKFEVPLPFGYHMDLDFLRFCSDDKIGTETLERLKDLQRVRRHERRTLETMMGLRRSSGGRDRSTSKSVSPSRNISSMTIHHHPTSVAPATPDLINTSDFVREALKDAVLDFEQCLERSTRSHDSQTLRSFDLLNVASSTPLGGYGRSQTFPRHYPPYLSPDEPDRLFRPASNSSISSISTSSSPDAILAGLPSSVPPKAADHHAALETESIASVNSDMSTATLKNIRDQIVKSLAKLKEYERQVEAIPVLQVKLSVLKEEKRLLILKLKQHELQLKRETRGVADLEDFGPVDDEDEVFEDSGRREVRFMTDQDIRQRYESLRRARSESPYGGRQLTVNPEEFISVQRQRSTSCGYNSEDSEAGPVKKSQHQHQQQLQQSQLGARRLKTSDSAQLSSKQTQASLVTPSPEKPRKVSTCDSSVNTDPVQVQEEPKKREPVIRKRDRATNTDPPPKTPPPPRKLSQGVNTEKPRAMFKATATTVGMNDFFTRDEVEAKIQEAVFKTEEDIMSCPLLQKAMARVEAEALNGGPIVESGPAKDVSDQSCQVGDENLRPFVISVALQCKMDADTVVCSECLNRFNTAAPESTTTERFLQAVQGGPPVIMHSIGVGDCKVIEDRREPAQFRDVGICTEKWVEVIKASKQTDTEDFAFKDTESPRVADMVFEPSPERVVLQRKSSLRKTSSVSPMSSRKSSAASPTPNKTSSTQTNLPSPTKAQGTMTDSEKKKVLTKDAKVGGSVAQTKSVGVSANEATPTRPSTLIASQRPKAAATLCDKCNADIHSASVASSIPASPMSPKFHAPPSPDFPWLSKIPRPVPENPDVQRLKSATSTGNLYVEPSSPRSPAPMQRSKSTLTPAVARNVMSPKGSPLSPTLLKRDVGTPPPHPSGRRVSSPLTRSYSPYSSSSALGAGAVDKKSLIPKLSLGNISSSGRTSQASSGPVSPASAETRSLIPRVVTPPALRKLYPKLSDGEDKLAAKDRNVVRKTTYTKDTAGVNNPELEGASKPETAAGETKLARLRKKIKEKLSGSDSDSDEGNKTDEDYSKKTSVDKAKRLSSGGFPLPGAALFTPIDINRTKAEPSKEMKAALKVLNDSLSKGSRSNAQITNAVNIVQQEWFKASSTKQSNPLDVEDYLDAIEDISKELLDRVVNLTDVNGNTALHYSVSHGSFDVVSVLLDSKVANPNIMNKAGYTCIMLISLAQIQNGTNRAVVSRLFSLGDVNIRATQHGQTALMLAVSHGRLDMVQLLVEAGADVNIRDEDGSTALMCAAEHGHMEIVKYLVQHQDTDVLAKDNDGLTALAVAMEAGHRDVGVVLYANMSFSRGSSPYSSMRVRRPVSSASRGSTPTSSTPAATSTSTKTPPPIGPTPPQRTRRKSVDK